PSQQFPPHPDHRLSETSAQALRSPTGQRHGPGRVDHGRGGIFWAVFSQALSEACAGKLGCDVRKTKPAHPARKLYPKQVHPELPFSRIYSVIQCTDHDHFDAAADPEHWSGSVRISQFGFVSDSHVE